MPFIYMTSVDGTKVAFNTRVAKVISLSVNTQIVTNKTPEDQLGEANAKLDQAQGPAIDIARQRTPTEFSGGLQLVGTVPIKRIVASLQTATRIDFTTTGGNGFLLVRESIETVAALLEPSPKVPWSPANMPG